MLSYQHGYHAGNFADVIKHITLMRLLAYLCQKDKPLVYMDTHSGRGLYDLKASQSLKTLEFKQGIDLLWEAKAKVPLVLQSYIEILEALNPDGNLRFYPGSPYLALQGLREKDRLFFSELHKQEYSHLSQLNTHGRNVYFNQGDGFAEVLRVVPPIERRGLIFIDPTYEVKQEYKLIPALMAKAHARFATGVYCLWYPIVDKRLHQQLLTNLKTRFKGLNIEFYLTAIPNGAMYGCGLWLINPPYLLAEEMKTALDFLRLLFNPGISSYTIESY